MRGLTLDNVAELYIDVLDESGEREAERSLRYYSSCFAKINPGNREQIEKRGQYIYKSLKHKAGIILRRRELEIQRT